ncbi:MAG: TetR/AcrR family transcriptional regulator [Anaerolineae bacterium]|nr:TetR/AcrR family transcriptional regulator [Anaerolineae bacterium]
MNRFERRKAQTYQRLQKIGVELILAHGYEAVTVQQITDTTDVARGTFYQHFRDKAALIESVIADEFRDLLTGEGLSAWQSLIQFFQVLQRHRSLLERMPEGDRLRVVSDELAALVLRPFPLDDVPMSLNGAMRAGGLARAMSWWVDQATAYPVETIALYVYRWWYRCDPPIE